MMLKQSKIQISLIVILGLMILGQVGFVLYKGSHPPIFSEKKTAPVRSTVALAPPQENHFHARSVKELDHVFHRWNYNLARVKSQGTVPRLYLAKLPPNMVKKKKASNPTFIQVLLPHILKVNEQILADRARLVEMQDRQKKGGHLRHAEKTWLRKLAAEYRCKSTKISSLLMHVDIVPPSLALAQGILETGGGRSHAALKKNSPFGYMATKTKVAKFESLLHSVKAYILNLNRHFAYTSFRKERAALRKKNKNLCGPTLAAFLTKYSERGKAYTEDLQRLIQALKLKGYDHVTLDRQPVHLKL